MLHFARPEEPVLTAILDKALDELWDLIRNPRATGLGLESRDGVLLPLDEIGRFPWAGHHERQAVGRPAVDAYPVLQPLATALCPWVSLTS